MVDFACGAGRHVIAAARLGADVTAVDWSQQRLELAACRAADAGVSVNFVRLDLERDPLELGVFDVVMIFRYLDRRRMPDFVKGVGPGGRLLFETFREDQPKYGWGPTSADHLLKPLELLSLVHPLSVEFSREVVETIDTESSALASIVAHRLVE